MAVSPLGVFVGLILLFFAPGFFLLHALFPGRRYFGPFHPIAMPSMSIVMSVAITVLVGTMLGFLGRFEGAQSFGGAGRPVIELTLASISVILLSIGWWRGAFGLLPSPRGRGFGRGRVPLLGRVAEYDNVGERGEPEEVTMLRDIRLEEERLRKEAARVRKRASQSRDPGVRSALTDAATDLDRDRKEVERRARDVEKRAGERRYGLSAKRSGNRWGGR